MIILKPGMLFCIICTFLFYILNLFLTFIIPTSAKNSIIQSWKWKNIFTSLIHSIITGIWACLCFTYYPEMAEDLINISSVSSQYLVSFSVGYFIFDFIDMALHHHKRSSYEMMVHHLFVIVCFGLTVVTRNYIGYAVVALLVEVNSIFLHIRQLLIIIGTNKYSSAYRLVALANIATFIVFRIVVLGWMTRWLMLNREVLSFPVYSLASVGLTVIIVMNTVLFYRICSVDFYSTSEKYKKIPESESKFEKEEADSDVHFGANCSLSQNPTNDLFSRTPDFHLD